MTKAEKRSARRKIKALIPFLTGREKKRLNAARKKDKMTKARPGIKQWCLEQGDKLANFETMKKEGLL